MRKESKQTLLGIIGLTTFFYIVRFLGIRFGWISTMLEDWIQRNEWIMFAAPLAIALFFF
jgi:hypothetical protein